MWDPENLERTLSAYYTNKLRAFKKDSIENFLEQVISEKRVNGVPPLRPPLDPTIMYIWAKEMQD